VTPERASELRKPFPPSAVGKLPKPYKKDSPKGQCRECGGYHGMPAVHLDYVGHAATTDRLLTVDPEWSWEPMALDQFGSPQLDRDGNLWIRLTILGVTRIGVGDGSSMKERIGDAIRNAAMRFGVALDLWSKEELEQAHGPAAPMPFPEHGTQPTEATPDQPPAEKPNADKPMRDKTRGQMFALFSKKGVAEDAQLPGINHITGQAYTSRADVTEAHARAVIDVLKKRPDAPTQGGDQ
jgi:hypothetical protein